MPKIKKKRVQLVGAVRAAAKLTVQKAGGRRLKHKTVSEETVANAGGINVLGPMEDRRRRAYAWVMSL